MITALPTNESPHIDGSLIIGTAGHIDHGKTSLVHALTGIDTDRLPVEKARGITTELGFAHLQLSVGADTTSGPLAASQVEAKKLRQVAMIDVPGHEKFVHAMVTGVGGIDVVCFVISAEEGIKPQTREHMDICRMLGVQRCVVALTKIDAVTQQRLSSATEEVAIFLDDTPYAQCAVVPVSARSGQGITELKGALGAALAAVLPRRQGRVFRLPIDRVFSLKGVGTVVTGTVMGGVVRVEDQLDICGRQQHVRVRGLQVHGKPALLAQSGTRVAINVVGVQSTIGVEDFQRGHMLAQRSACATSHIVDVQVNYVAAAKKALPSESQVIIHHGAAQVSAKMRLIAAQDLAPGATGSAQLRFDERHAMVMLPGDRFVIRGSRDIANHGRTLGGGVVVRAAASKYRKNKKHIFDIGAAADDQIAVGVELQHVGVRSIDRIEISKRCGIDELTTTNVLHALCTTDRAVLFGDKWAMASASVLQLSGQIGAAVASASALRREALRQLVAKAGSKTTAEVFLAVLQRCAQQGSIALLEDMVSKPVAAPAAPSNNKAEATKSPAVLSALATNLLRILSQSEIATPKPSELAATLRMAEHVAMQQLHDLIKAGLVCKIKPDYFVSASAVVALQKKLFAHFEQHALLTPTQWKELTAASRKYSIPLIEYFDAQKITLRVGDDRKLRARS